MRPDYLVPSLLTEKSRGTGPATESRHTLEGPFRGRPARSTERPGVTCRTGRRSRRGPSAREEETMVYVLFMVVAFVLLGIERLVAWRHPEVQADRRRS